MKYKEENNDKKTEGKHKTCRSIFFYFCFVIVDLRNDNTVIGRIFLNIKFQKIDI